jgi:SAM-dependent methyltransferase
LNSELQTSAVGPFSFRDPGGVLVRREDSLFRIVTAAAASDLRHFLESRLGGSLLQQGSLAATRILENAEVAGLLADRGFRFLYENVHGELVLEHERILFPSFPYEWPAEMLYSAAALTLDLARRGIAEDIGLKDATPLNVLFRGPKPVFVDVLSFESRDRRDSTWLPYAQFVRTFLLPLLAWKYFGLAPEQTLTTRRDGLEPEEVYRWLSSFQRLKPPFLSLVSLPCWLSKQKKAADTALYERKLSGNPEKSRFILESLLNGLGRSLRKLRPPAGSHSVWSDYAVQNSYSTNQATTKQAFVADALSKRRPGMVLDIGCNTGVFSAIAARSGAAVVAIDYDPVVVGSVWSAAQAENLNILPLVVNFGRPTPATGWRNEEFPSFLERARGRFDAVLMLAVLHHLLVTERVPLDAILRTASELTTDVLIIEFVGVDDPMFRKIARGRESLHADLTPAYFESIAARYFRLERREDIEGSSRILYIYKKK